ncbi:MAG: DUF2243 domain-containing protein [Candidatus Nanopelagicales bacterium]|jgi:uncharacterized membrane protein|nr:DUF2243 domain-containing protein [Candidatus Nanopelagicales bacterium]
MTDQLRTGPTSSGDGCERRPATGPWVLLGVGLGGFVDGILLHQVLQWHHLLTAHPDHPPTTVPGLQANTLADGLFHVGSWVAVAAGLAWLLVAWRRGAPAPRPRWAMGLLLLGWGLFNLVEGAVNHHLLGLHHVRDDLGGPLAWDLGFLAFGLLLVLIGGLLARTDPPQGASAGRATTVRSR